MTRRDLRTADLFEVPRPASPVPGSQDYRAVIAGLVGQMLDLASRAGKDRYAVAAEVSRLAGKEVSKYMLDAYTAASREEYNAPAWLVPLIEAVCDCHLYSSWLAEIRGGRLYIGRDSLVAELGRVERACEELADQRRALKDQLKRGR